MNPSMINAMTSMNTLQQKLDILANNISNMDTVGYKRQDASFHDILTVQKRQHPAKVMPGRLTDLGLTLGNGAMLSQQLVDFSQGSLRPTEVPTDIAIEGNGLIEVGIPRRDDNGQVLLNDDGAEIIDRTWTRSGALQLTRYAGDEDHTYLATQDGHVLRTAEGELIAIPHPHKMLIDDYGRVFSYNEHSQDSTPEFVGQLAIAQVVRPQLLESLGNGLFRLPEHVENINDVLRSVGFESDPNFTFGEDVTFEEAGISIRQGFLEQSNVSLAAEMTELINIQRAYQLNARALSSSDTMMGLAVQLRG